MLMKSLQILATILITPGFYACKQSPETITLKEYRAVVDSGIQTGGVKMIATETPIDKFNVWTRRLGNNPKIKVLLLHGGPGGILAMEYDERLSGLWKI